MTAGFAILGRENTGGKGMAMSSHVTLRGLLGLGDEPAALRDSALIMIDCQNTYRRGVMQLDGAEDAFAEAARLLARARANGVPVFHVMHDAGPGSPYDIKAEIGQISSVAALGAVLAVLFLPAQPATPTARQAETAGQAHDSQTHTRPSAAATSPRPETGRPDT